MAKRTVLEGMKANLLEIFTKLYFILLSIVVGETVSETGEILRFIRLEVEVPRGYGLLSRCRFTVKIPDGKLKIEGDELDNNDYVVKFDDLSISYIDNKGNVYFRAKDYEVKKEA